MERWLSAPTAEIWACLAEQTLVKKQSRNGEQRGSSCLQRHAPGRKSHWSQLWEQLVQNTSSLLHQRSWGQAMNPGLSSTSSATTFPKKEAAKTRPIPWACIWWVSRVPQGASAEEHPVSAFRFELHTELATAVRQGHSQSWSAKEKGNSKAEHWD